MDSSQLVVVVLA